jgi:tRNA nucleotidyltransferase (CCA-adding enzyme)
MTRGGWEQFEVEADVGVRGWGPSRAAAVAQLTLGVFSLIAVPASVEVRERREVRAQAEGPEALLVTWINECLYVHEIEGFVVHDVEMTVCTDTLAHGYLHGEPLDLARHRIGGVVKGATYHQAALIVHEGVHEVRLIVDV